MSTHVLFALIAVQVVVFQFLSFRISWSLPRYLVGVERLPPAVSEGVAEFRRKGRLLRYVLGAVLCLVAFLSTFVLELSAAQAKVSLAAISILSSAALVAGMVLDRKQMRRLAAELPEASVRSAVLERRKLAQYYPVWLESIPFLILAAVMVASFWAAPIAFVSGTSALRVWAIPLVLALMIGGGWILSRRLAVSGCRVPQKTRAFLPSAENPIRMGEAVTALELRCFMAAKIGFAFLLALMQTEKLAEFAGSEVPPAVGLLQWLLPAAMLGLFAGYIIKLSKLSRFKSQGKKGS